MHSAMDTCAILDAITMLTTIRRFSGDESFLKDPNAFNDTINEAAAEGEGTVKKGHPNL